jgi:tetratricopeptide (TPR) repeat protein
VARCLSQGVQNN